MTRHNDKYVVGCWLRLYNHHIESDYQVVAWPDEDSLSEAVDAVCKDRLGRTLAIEHTLIQPFVDEKKDTEHFSQTLGSLENHPDLLQPGYAIEIQQRVKSIPRGKRTSRQKLREEMCKQMKSSLPKLPEGESSVAVNGVELYVNKSRTMQNEPSSVTTSRLWPGNPGGVLVRKAFKDKIPKLANALADRKFLLLEKDAAAGTIESQFRHVADDPEIQNLLKRIDEVWVANTASLEIENFIFSNQIWPGLRIHRCSLNLLTGEFWRGPC